MRTDICIVGGGIMGSSLAYWLTRLAPKLDVLVVERDPTYARASSALSAASIRQQYATPVNIRISARSIAFLRAVDEHLAVDGDRPDIALEERGYLYLAGPANRDFLEVSHAVQRREGADVCLLSPAELRQRFPWLEVDDLALGSLGLRGEGWFDGYRLLAAFGRRARAQGARYRRGDVVAVDRIGGRVTGVRLDDGTNVACGALVDAAGPWARQVAGMAGLVLPVSARRRTVFVCSCPVALPGFPLLIDTSGLWIRPEGRVYIGGVTPADDRPDLPLDEPDLEPFESTYWPALAARVPAFEALRLERAWAGYYDMNDFDHNAIVGPHPEVENFWFMNGFSGHGMQQAPAVGEALAERMIGGRYVTTDLSMLGFERVAAGRPLRESHIIG